MKNQYVGDINDYYKYGLLRILSGFGEKRLGVCWMLTPERTEYLDNRRQWGEYDTVLFNKLKRIVHARTVWRIKEAEILRRARFWEEIIKPNPKQRERYFDEMLGKFADVDLIFFDPDTGLAPSASKRGSKWLCDRELKTAFDKGHSVIFIQFPWRKKDWVTLLLKRIHEATGGATVWTFQTPNKVAFFLAAQQRHLDFFRRRAMEVKKRWGSKVTVNPDPDSE